MHCIFANFFVLCCTKFKWFEFTFHMLEMCNFVHLIEFSIYMVVTWCGVHNYQLTLVWFLDILYPECMFISIMVFSEFWTVNSLHYGKEKNDKFRKNNHKSVKIHELNTYLHASRMTCTTKSSRFNFISLRLVSLNLICRTFDIS